MMNCDVQNTYLFFVNLLALKNKKDKKNTGECY